MKAKEIREILARLSGEAPSYPFFSADYIDGETPDEALERMFNQEKLAQQLSDYYTSDDAVVRILYHG